MLHYLMENAILEVANALLEAVTPVFVAHFN